MTERNGEKIAKVYRYELSTDIYIALQEFKIYLIKRKENVNMRSILNGCVKFVSEQKIEPKDFRYFRQADRKVRIKNEGQNRIF